MSTIVTTGLDETSLYSLEGEYARHATMKCALFDSGPMCGLSTLANVPSLSRVTAKQYPSPILEILWEEFALLQQAGYHHGGRRAVDERVKLTKKLLTYSSKRPPKQEQPVIAPRAIEAAALHRILLRLILVTPPVGEGRNRAELRMAWIDSFWSYYFNQLNETADRVLCGDWMMGVQSYCRPSKFTPQKGYIFNATPSPSPSTLNTALFPVPIDAVDDLLWRELARIIRIGTAGAR